MSIIEKAANRLHKSPAAETEAQEPAIHPVEEDRPSTIEAARSRADGSDLPPAEVTRAQRTVTIQTKKLTNAGMISPDGERSKISEEFRLIKRPLIANAFGQGSQQVNNGNLIMVTSSFPGEGKSFCAINLALSIAMELDRTVLLVDADVAKPSLPRFLGFEAEKGLLDLLLDDKLTVADVMLKTNIPKLTILPAGRTHKYATELLSSEAMHNLINELSNRYPDRLIIFDSPPLLATSEASVLATHMGQIVLVVEAEKTPREKINEALSLLESCEVIGLLLNKGHHTSSGEYYYGNYGS